MSYIIIHQAMQNTQAGKRGPMGRGEKIIGICLALACVIGVAWFVIYAIDFDNKKQQALQDWSAGIGRPNAAVVNTGQTVTIPSTATISEYWDQCTQKMCNNQALTPLPMVYPIGRLKLGSHCHSVQIQAPVSKIRAAATPYGGTYTVSLGERTIEFCLIGKPSSPDDMLVIWQDTN